MSVQWQSYIYGAGGIFMCVESYDSIFERMRDGAFAINEDEMKWAAPLELTVAVVGKSEGDSPRPVRALIQPHAISAVMEIPEDNRQDVEEAAA